MAVFGSGLHLTVEDATSAEPAIRQALATDGIDIRKLEVISPSMEDVFVAMIEDEERRTS